MILSRLINKTKKILGKSNEPASHEYKEKIIVQYAEKYKLSSFIETGTYMGDMLAACYDKFDYLSSVEVSKELYEKAVVRFSDREKIHLYNGDSSKLLFQMINDNRRQNRGGVLFWLDGHYSGGVTSKAEKDTPIMEELEEIKKSDLSKSVLLIDDARCFIHEGEFIDYPTLKELKKTIKFMWPRSKFRVYNDVIRIVI